ncbi:hypothetical protein BS50DRAFT_625697 [Corynespora cassiicola Philippines]|uniref:Uncharacterized protein n=1 Tax=Corynespora cassiicola Philippines TaxID=1448308 RepID=A0A2T2N6P5_CORCC|nr:hypothetical protein BS50DRAFT_625697 [Corynespora cassiicola Philippines]
MCRLAIRPSNRALASDSRSHRSEPSRPVLVWALDSGEGQRLAVSASRRPILPKPQRRTVIRYRATAPKRQSPITRSPRLVSGHTRPDLPMSLLQTGLPSSPASIEAQQPRWASTAEHDEAADECGSVPSSPSALPHCHGPVWQWRLVAAPRRGRRGRHGRTAIFRRTVPKPPSHPIFPFCVPAITNRAMTSTTDSPRVFVVILCPPHSPSYMHVGSILCASHIPMHMCLLTCCFTQRETLFPSV